MSPRTSFVATAPASPGCPVPAVEPPTDATVLADECVEITVPAQDLVTFDGSSVLVEQGENPPACAGFTLDFAWEVDGSQPVQFLVNQQGVEELVASGTGGTGSGYCGTVRIENPADQPVDLTLRYVLGDLG